MHDSVSAGGRDAPAVSEAAVPSRQTPNRCWHPALPREAQMERGLSPGVECRGSAPHARLRAPLVQPHGFWPGACSQN